MMLVITISLVAAASAQRVVAKGGVGVPGTRTVVVVGGGFGYSPFYRPYYGYNPYWYNRPYYNRPYYNRPSKLEVKIQDIRNDYADKIWSARQDKDLSGRDRRHEIKNLRHERDHAIDNLKSNYYKQ